MKPDVETISGKDTNRFTEAEVRYAALRASCQLTETELELKNEELARLRQELEAVRNRYYQLFDLGPVGYIILGHNGLIGEINLTAADLLGYSRSDLLQKAFFHFIREGDRPVLYKYMRDLKGSTLPRDAELYIVTESGQLLFVKLSAVPIGKSGADGENRQLFVSLTDITKQKQAEEILKRDKDVFEKQVEEKSTELSASREELFKAQRLAEIGSLAAIVAHELRSPLAAINATVYNITKNENRPVILEKLAKIEKKVEESSHIIDNLLSYSRVRLPHFKELILGALLTDIVKCEQETYAEQKVTLSADLESVKELVIRADIYQLSEVFYNVLNNAYQSFEPGNMNRFIRIKANIREKHQVEITIQDTGPGIPEADLSKIFKPFFTRKAKGTGLGLTISKEVIQMHGGTLELCSHPGQGTTVIITLPLP